MSLNLKPKEHCRWDLVSLGEVMLRFDPGDRRIGTTRSFEVSEGGGEYNVARGLKRCFGLNAAVVTAIVDNPVGRLLQDLIYQGGVDQSLVRWVADDGVEAGLPAGEKWLSSFTADCYHQTCDAFSPAWDLRGAAQEAELFYRIGARLANSRAWPEWNPTSEFAKVRARSAAVRSEASKR